MIDHDAIAARVRQDMKAGTPGPWKETAMCDAPELLWLWPAEPEDGVDKFVSFPGQPYPSGSTTYIRADLSDALLREAMGALKQIVSQIDQGGSEGKVFSRDACITQARATLAKLRAHLGETE